MRVLRPIAILTAFLFVGVTARAGDMATLNILGFSPDGAIFAFEEYGVQDGSGFPYANRYYIDTAADRFLPSTPVRVHIQDGQATVEEARADAKDQAESVISDENLTEGFRAGWNAVTELSAEPHRMMVNPRPIMPPLDETLEFRLEELSLQYPENCRDLGERIFGFRLLRIGTSGGEQTGIVHEDKRVPSSRGCPLGYSIAGIQTYHPRGEPAVFAVIIAVRRFGFEGPDHRFMAVTGRL
ncbi:DUF2259 domain-containing protein [Chelativorans sp. YIM 93263]|uniref:DUF2259 domain-containing protein n=1 Tax=Chelativorans sp. YIM 93263 TaxID=2906648 RepID=UPI002378BF4D|nr:DUF2259 domain-containing protein [Chelativorans sp. YIM 93263]